MSFIASFAFGAFMLATWLDGRFAARRPETPRACVVHVVASCILLQLAGMGAGLLVPESAGTLPKLLAIFCLILPVLTYAFVAAVWLLRAFAEQGFARR
jgi:hypothetical protein